MAEEIPQAGNGSEERPRSPEAETPGARGRGARILAWILVAFLGVFVCIQLAGVLLRDTLERRRPLLARPPAAEPLPAGKLAPQGPSGPEPSRFGPEIQEVVVARGDTPAPTVPPAVPALPVKVQEKAAPPAPAPAPTTEKVAPSKKPPPSAASTPRAKAAQDVAPPKATQEAPRAAAEKGTHVLLVDVFLSQKYLREAEQRLKKLGVPFTHTEFLRKGAGFKVQVAATGDADRGRAEKVIASEGYLVRPGPQGVESYFYYRNEAQAVADMLAKRGIEATVAPVDAERPYWRLLAGPFSEEEAKRARQRLSDAGLATTLEALP